MTPVLVRFCHTVNAGEAELAAAIDLLSDDERARCDRFVFARDRRDFAFAHALLRRTLSDCCELPAQAWTFAVEEEGKPALTANLAVQTSLSFNLSHTNGLVACAIARDATVGIDVETLDRHTDFTMDVAGRFFSPAEVAVLQRCSDEERHQRFAEIWTVKEAYLKAIGKGLSGLGLCVPRHDPAWTFALFAPSPSYRMAVAVTPRAPLDCPSPSIPFALD